MLQFVIWGILIQKFKIKNFAIIFLRYLQPSTLLQLPAKNYKNQMLQFVRKLKKLTSSHVQLKNFKTTPLIFCNTI